MSKLNRRDFLQYTVGGLTAATLMPGVGQAAAVPAPKATDIRRLGNTGLECTYLGIGTGTRGSAPGVTDQTQLPEGEFVNLLEHAYQQGITYFDMADRYGSHSYMRAAMARSIPRDNVMLLSKVWSREPKAAKADVERFRQELDTDTIDVVLMHCIRGGEENWPETLKPLMDVLSDAKAKGHIRAHGVSCHVLPALERVPEEEWVDVALARINPFGSHMDGPVEKVVPIIDRIHKAGKGVLGMKILGEGDPKVVEEMDESLKFVTELGAVDAMTIGFLSVAEFDDAVKRINGVGAA